jgi:hypothetical protein
MIESPRLICAAPDIEPGSIKIAWTPDTLPCSLTLKGNDADNALERFRSAPDERARALLLVSVIETTGAANV